MKLVILIDGTKLVEQQHIYSEVWIDGLKQNNVQKIMFELKVENKPIIKVTTFEGIDEDIQQPVYKDTYCDSYVIATYQTWKERYKLRALI